MPATASNTGDARSGSATSSPARWRLPSTTPTSSSPITAGWPRRSNSSPIALAATSNTVSATSVLPSELVTSDRRDPAEGQRGLLAGRVHRPGPVRERLVAAEPSVEPCFGAQQQAIRGRVRAGRRALDDVALHRQQDAERRRVVFVVVFGVCFLGGACVCVPS